MPWPNLPAEPPTWWSILEAKARLDPHAEQIVLLVRRHTANAIPFGWPLPWPVNGVCGGWALAALDIADLSEFSEPQDRLIMRRWS